MKDRQKGVLGGLNTLSTGTLITDCLELFGPRESVVKIELEDEATKHTTNWQDISTSPTTKTILANGELLWANLNRNTTREDEGHR